MRTTNAVSKSKSSGSSSNKPSWADKSSKSVIQNNALEAVGSRSKGQTSPTRPLDERSQSPSPQISARSTMKQKTAPLNVEFANDANQSFQRKKSMAASLAVSGTGSMNPSEARSQMAVVNPPTIRRRPTAGDLATLDKCLAQRVDIAERAFMSRVTKEEGNADRVNTVMLHFANQILKDINISSSKDMTDILSSTLFEVINFSSRLSFEVNSKDLKEYERIKKLYDELMRRNLDSQSKYSAECIRMETEIKKLSKDPDLLGHDIMNADKESVSFYDSYMHLDDKYRDFVWQLSTQRLRFLCEAPGEALKAAVIAAFNGIRNVPGWASAGGGGGGAGTHAG